jgi:hypothetical protein
MIYLSRMHFGTTDARTTFATDASTTLTAIAIFPYHRRALVRRAYAKRDEPFTYFRDGRSFGANCFFQKAQKLALKRAMMRRSASAQLDNHAFGHVFDREVYSCHVRPSS